MPVFYKFCLLCGKPLDIYFVVDQGETGIVRSYTDSKRDMDQLTTQSDPEAHGVDRVYYVSVQHERVRNR